MKIHVLVEGPSEKALLECWLPRAFRGHEFQVLKHSGKGRLPGARPNRRARGLLDLLPQKLRAYGKSFGDDDGVLVLVDADVQSCVDLKRDLVALAASINPRPHVVFRIAVEETEAFYFGDLAAIKLAYPGADHVAARAFTPDSICGTAERFGAVVGDGGNNKVAWAEAMGKLLTTDPSRSRSPSFKAFHGGITKLIALGAAAKAPAKKKGKHWKAKTAKPRR